MRKFLAIVLTLAMVTSLMTPAMAAELESSDQSSTMSFATSSTGWMEITCSGEEKQTNANEVSDKENSYPFEIKQFEGNEIVQTVTGSCGGDRIIVTDYKDGEVVKTESIMVSDRVKQESLASDENVDFGKADINATSVGTKIGTITYNKSSITNIEEKIAVYSKLTNRDNEAYTINGKKSDTLAVITGLIASVVSVFVSGGLSIPKQIAVAIISSAGGSVAGGAIGVVFTEEVAVNASYYTMKGYHARSNKYSSAYTGIARQVLTKKSKSYNKWFYEGFTPQNWKSGDNLAICLWNNLIKLTYPHVKSYT